jgi:hypothetical protein
MRPPARCVAVSSEVSAPVDATNGPLPVGLGSPTDRPRLGPRLARVAAWYRHPTRSTGVVAHGPSRENGDSHDPWETTDDP